MTLDHELPSQRVLEYLFKVALKQPYEEAVLFLCVYTLMPRGICARWITYLAVRNPDTILGRSIIHR